MKFLTVFLTLLCLGTHIYAMDNKCELTIELERNDLAEVDENTNKESLYLYTGYGSMSCPKQNPFTVFSAIRLNAQNAKTNNIQSFNVIIKNIRTEPFVNVFQSYNFLVKNNKASLHFNTSNPSAPLHWDLELLSKELTSDNEHSNFINSLNNSTFIIEQDQFFSDTL